MSNMSYCRFENTYRELCDCVEHIEDENLSESEKFYRGRIIELSKEISEFDEIISDEGWNVDSRKFIKNYSKMVKKRKR